MIISLTMNPAVDKTIYLDELRMGSLNRSLSQNATAGGKGINVANDLVSFGTETVIAGFVADKNLDIIKNCIDELESKGVVPEFVKINGRNRTNVKIIENNGRLTEINEQGFEVTPENINELIEKLLKYACPENSFILTGSVPRGVSKAIYRQLADVLKKNGANVYVDADGELLKYAVESAPRAIKPNELELLEYFGDKSFSEKTLISRAKELVDKGIETVIVSRGSRGSLFIQKNSVVKCEALDISVKSSVGAGDAMIAAFAFRMEKGYPYDECVKYSVASSAYAAMLETPYFTNSEEIQNLVKRVNMIVLE